MKKLLTLCFLLATISTINAQTKKTTTTKKPVKKETTVVAPAPIKGPTKEETITFIKEYFISSRISSGVTKAIIDVEKNFNSKKLRF